MAYGFSKKPLPALRKHTTYNGVRLIREASKLPWQTECGRFVVRSTGNAGTMARWVIKAIDGSTPFPGYRGKKNASSTELADTLDDAGVAIESARAKIKA